MKFFFYLNQSKLKHNLKINKNPNNFSSIYLNIDKNFIKKLKNFFNKPYLNIFFTKIFLKFYNLFFNYIKLNLNTNNYIYFNEIMSSLNNNFFLNNPIFFNSWFISYFNFIFCLKSKKQKKIIENKISLLTPNKRNIYFFKILKYQYFLKKNKSIHLFFNEIMLDSYLNFKNSAIYFNKLNIYKKFLNN